MRRLLYFATGAILASCATSPKYDLTGTTGADLDGKKVYLERLDSAAQYVAIDSAVVSNQHFTFKGTAQEPAIAMITVASENNPALPFILENGNIQMTLGAESKVSGTAANDSLQSYYNHIDEISKQIKVLVEEFEAKRSESSLTEEDQKAIMSKYEQLQGMATDYSISFIKANQNSLAGMSILSNYLTALSVEQIDQILAAASPAFKATPLMNRIDSYLTALRRSEVGAMYTNITMPDLQGQNISLSDYIGKGKYVLVDFWASWCGPCRAEMPVVVEAYKKYADKGFEIVGISFDNNKEAWEKGVKDLNMTWPQMSDLKGWQSEAGVVYGIRSIPATLLFDPQGKIIAKNLRGEELANTLAQYLK